MAQPMIPPSVLAQFRDMTESMMDSRAVLTLPGAWVSTGGGSGYQLPGEQVVFDCRLTALSNQNDLREFMQANQLTVSNTLQLTYPLAVAELKGDSSLTIDGATYTVAGVPPLGTYAQHRIALVRKVGA